MYIKKIKGKSPFTPFHLILEVASPYDRDILKKILNTCLTRTDGVNDHTRLCDQLLNLIDSNE